MIEDFKDIFIIHSKSDPLEEILASRVSYLLSQMNISTYGYSDWEWTEEKQRTKYSSSEGSLDPIRYSIGHPEPFRKKVYEDVPDEDTLREMLENARVIVFIAPRAGSPSAGVYLEESLLDTSTSYILASWGSHNDWLVDRKCYSFLYHLPDIYSNNKETESLDLTHLTWLHWRTEYLSYEGGTAGRKVLLACAKQHRALVRILKCGYRSSKVFKESTETLESHNLEVLESDVLAISKATTEKDARMVAVLWTKQKLAYAKLAHAPNLKVSSLVKVICLSLDVFCAEVQRMYPTLNQ